jgi:predicted transcriptional regulator
MDNNIEIPADLRRKLEKMASARNISVGEVVRESLEQTVSRANDPLFADDTVFRGNSPTDGATNHDDYLYGENS